MTRITNFSRKRTHHEAEFNNLFEKDGTNANPAGDDHSEQPKTKKRKYELEKEKRQKKREFKAKIEGTNTGWGRSEEIKGKSRTD